MKLITAEELIAAPNNNMKKLHASYWKYDGNHYNGRDCERYDPHGLGIELISYLAYIADCGGYGKLTQQQLSQVKVIHRKGNSFGHEIKVIAPKEIWDAAKVDYYNLMLEVG